MNGKNRFVRGALRADEGALDALYPRGAVCLLCGRASAGALLCADCGELLAAERLEDEDVPAAWPYEGLAGRLVRMLKDHAVAAAAEVLAAGVADAAGQAGEGAVTLTWVPMPPERLRERGIDHGRALAEAAARLLGQPCRQLLQRRPGSSRHTQRGLNAEERRRNVADAFLCPAPPPARVLLVDDVRTTGATLAACRECLLQAGAEEVAAVTATVAEFREDKSKEQMP